MAIKEESTNANRTNRSAELVKQLRTAFLDDYDNEKESYDEEDVLRIKEDDWLVKRFLLARKRDVNNALAMLKNALKMRRQYLVALAKDYYFPVEFYKSGGLFIYEKDKQGNLTVYMRISFHKKIPELEHFLKVYLLHVFEKADRLSNGHFVVVFDMTNAGYANMDWDFLNFLLDCAGKHFPVGLKYVLVTNLHWMLNALRKAVFAILPENLMGIIKFASGDEIFDYIDKGNVPDFLGGTCRTNYMQAPKTSPPIMDVCEEHGHPKETVERLLPLYKPLLDEADRRLASGSFIDRDNFFDEEVFPTASDAGDVPFIVEPSNAVLFVYDTSAKRYVGELLVQNLSDNPLAFKVQSNLPQNYLVSPRLGIILPKSGLLLRIELIPGHEFQSKIGKFLVLGSEVMEQSMKMTDFEKIWREKRQSVYTYKLRSEVLKQDVPTNVISNSIGHVAAPESNYKYLEAKYQELRRKQNQLMVLLIVVMFLLLLAIGIFVCELYFDANASDLLLNLKRVKKLYI